VCIDRNWNLDHWKDVCAWLVHLVWSVELEVVCMYVYLLIFSSIFILDIYIYDFSHFFTNTFDRVCTVS